MEKIIDEKRRFWFIQIALILAFVAGIIAGTQITNIDYTFKITNQEIFSYKNNVYLINKVNKTDYDKIISVIDFANYQYKKGIMNYTFILPEHYYIENNQLKYDFHKNTTGEKYKITQKDRNLINP